MYIILIGAQGSGKGTQAELLSQTLGIPHIASGDLFRKAIDEKTELGIKAKAYIDRGELVPDDLTVTMIVKRLEEPDCSQGVLFDGFPRTVTQAEVLDKGLQEVGKQIDLAIYLQVLRESILLHNLASDQVLLDNPLQDGWGAGVIPNGFRINDCNGAVQADAQAVHFASIDQRLRSR